MDRWKQKEVLGWIAILLSTFFTSVWAFWGIIENFHEGWYYPSTVENLKLMFVQYLSPMLIFLIVSLISIWKFRLGAVIHLLIALFLFWFFGGFSTPAVTQLAILPLLVLALLYWFGSVRSKRVAFLIALCLPVTTLLFGLPGAIRAVQRIDDGIMSERLIDGNGIRLVWAPVGFGYPERGAISWAAASEKCRFLSADGRSLTNAAVDVWRLPSVDESVRSMSLHGQNSGGVWNPDKMVAHYEITPDKESPLWQVHSPVIYRWTATEVDQHKALMIAYDGQVWPRDKRFAQDYFAFRCVKDP